MLNFLVAWALNTTLAIVEVCFMDIPAIQYECFKLQAKSVFLTVKRSVALF